MENKRAAFNMNLRCGKSLMPVIVGIDPGTTSAVAILDLRGNIVSLASKRNFGRADICKFILDNGRPLIVACDTTPAPKRVQKIASCFGARLVMPMQDMARKHKSELSKGLERRNIHERDALAAAMYAYKRIRPVTNRVYQALDYEDEGIFESVSAKVLEGNGLKASIQSSKGANF